MNSQTKMIIGAIAGATLGLLILGLYTTDEGRKTRRDLNKKRRKVRNKTLQQIGELKVGAKRRYETVKEAATDIIEEGKEKISGITNIAK